MKIIRTNVVCGEGHAASTSLRWKVNRGLLCNMFTLITLWTVNVICTVLPDISRYFTSTKDFATAKALFNANLQFDYGAINAGDTFEMLEFPAKCKKLSNYVMEFVGFTGEEP